MSNHVMAIEYCEKQNCPATQDNYIDQCSRYVSFEITCSHSYITARSATLLLPVNTLAVSLADVIHSTLFRCHAVAHVNSRHFAGSEQLVSARCQNEVHNSTGF